MNTTDIIIIMGGIVLAVLFLLLKSTKVPKPVYRSRTVYSDHREKPEKALFSSKHGLIGRPDFILHTKDGLLPLEIKHSLRPQQPYFSHVMQLISYCLLMEDRGDRPKYGFIQYRSGKAFSISYTEEMKASLLKTMEEMRGCLASGQKPKAVRRGKCDKCGCKEECFGAG